MRKKLTTPEFLERFYNRYPDGLGLDFSKFEYTKARSGSTVICPTHNKEFQNTPNNLLQGIKCCKECKSTAIAKAQNYTAAIFLKKATAFHGDRYDYSKVVYTDTRTNVEIVCKVHGSYFQNPQSHWNGYGCPHCGYRTLRKTQEQFIKDAHQTHGTRYSYIDVEYKNNYTKITIGCNIHGTFRMTPVSHLIYQRGCPSCYPGNQSWIEVSWLNELGVPLTCRQKRVIINGVRLLVDGKIGDTIYEFWGDFWHGNPTVFLPEDKNGKNGKSFGELYTATMIKRNLILSAGFTLVEMWESDFKMKK